MTKQTAHTHTHTQAHAHTLPASRDVVVTARRPIGGGAGRGLRGPASWRRVTGGGAMVRAPSREAVEVGVCGAVRPGLHVRRAHFGGGGGGGGGGSFFGHRASWTWQASTSEASMPPGRVLVPRGSRQPYKEEITVHAC
ncbi:ATP-dependent RNA helicase ded1-like [Bubalus bubalis]|uniref:ATP-dependent RNA helicase ded1-like n=1 Tax=Bubalus bubalis TaxID=89462 RepID=UPI001E1B7574|nr:ATP-dependent RNA helicase ded1-like [Bubalus bubalis]